MFVVALLLIGIVVALAAAAGWWLWRARTGPAGQPRQVWRLAPAPHDFFTAPEPVTVGAGRLVAGFGGRADDGSGLIEPPLRVLQHELGAELPALLTGNVGATYASIPSKFAGRVPAAAVSAGVMAWPVGEGAGVQGAATKEVAANGAAREAAGAGGSGKHVAEDLGRRHAAKPKDAGMQGAVANGGAASGAGPAAGVPVAAVHAAEAPGPAFRALPAPGWLLGLSATGEPVQVQLVPGSTVLLHGAGSAERLLDRLPTELPWVRVLRPETLAAAGHGAPTLGDAWREAWSPTICRVVLTESAEDATRNGIIPDLIIDARGSISHRGKRVGFDPMHLPSPLPLPHPSSGFRAAKAPKTAQNSAFAAQNHP